MAVIKIVPMPGAKGDKGDPGLTGPQGPAGDTYFVLTDMPSSSLGKIGDKAGYIAYSSDHLYFCIEDYEDGNVHIWKRISWESSIW
jgi:hypothetical protein